jgi:hypothetical protein
MEPSPDPNREMILLEQIEFDPDIIQASLASQLGVAVGHGQLASQVFDRQGMCESEACSAVQVAIYHHPGRYRISGAPDGELLVIYPYS